MDRDNQSVAALAGQDRIKLIQFVAAVDKGVHISRKLSRYEAGRLPRHPLVEVDAARDVAGLYDIPR
ncbi:hypothetical protein GCM10009680_78150 [Streptomyces yatensis]|uniref:Uncharacterized protein n=1 Tax=Streptomyces yatensis TaxID=155177 RepID=A0ABP4VIS0_9ACTN